MREILKMIYSRILETGWSIEIGTDCINDKKVVFRFRKYRKNYVCCLDVDDIKQAESLKTGFSFFVEHIIAELEKAENALKERD